MLDALAARVVAHYLGEEGALPRQTRAELERRGIRILAALDRAELKKLISAVPADVLLISSAHADPPGRTLGTLRRLYGHRSLAVLVLCGKGEDASALLLAGADDALPEGSAPALLAARVEAALRTAEQHATEPGGPGLLRTPDGEIALDPRARRCLLRLGGAYREILLTRCQFEALSALLRAQGAPVSWKELFRRGWRPGKLKRESRTLVQHVLALRRKLGAAGRRITALPGVGYRLGP